MSRVEQQNMNGIEVDKNRSSSVIMLIKSLLRTNRRIHPVDAGNELQQPDLEKLSNLSKTTLMGVNEMGDELHVPYYYVFLGFVGLIMGCILSGIVTLIPQTNIIESPDRWYEFTLVCAIGIGFGMAGNFGIIQPTYWMDIEYIKNWKSFASRFMIISVCLLILNACCYILWSLILENNLPMPLNYFICAPISFSIMQGLLWIHLPKEYRNKKTSKKKYKYFLFSQLIIVICFWIYLGTGYLLHVIDRRYQWILALLFPIIRELNQGILSKACCCSSESNDPWIKLSSWHWMGSVNAFFLTVAMASVATDITSYIILGVDFLLNMILCS